MKKNMFFLSLALLTAMLLTGCGETLNGMGKDVKRVGKGVKTIFVRDAGK